MRSRALPLRAFTHPLRLTLQFFVSHGPLKGLRLLATRLHGRPTPHLQTPLDLFPRQIAPSTHPFDLLYQVETSGFQHGEELGHVTDSSASAVTRSAAASTQLLPSSLWNTAYYGVAPSLFDKALALIGAPAHLADAAAPGKAAPPKPDWSRFTFVDLGCGKGRALLLASRLPFQSILGVELDPTLAAIAQANLRSFRAPWQQCHALQARHGDATAVDLPLTPLLLYLYHPFLAPALKRVLRRLEQSLHQHPRELWLLYINPEAASVLHGFPFLREHLRTTVVLDAEDALPDRLGSFQEEVAIYHATSPG